MIKYQCKIGKYIQEDHYENGCVGESREFGFIKTVQAPTLKELLSKVKNEYCHDIQFNPEDGDNFPFIEVLENSEGYEACETELAKWKKGSLKLWLAHYTFFIELIETKDIANEDIFNALFK